MEENNKEEFYEDWGSLAPCTRDDLATLKAGDKVVRCSPRPDRMTANGVICRVDRVDCSGVYVAPSLNASGLCYWDIDRLARLPKAEPQPNPTPAVEFEGREIEWEGKQIKLPAKFRVLSPSWTSYKEGDILEIVMQDQRTGRLRCSRNIIWDRKWLELVEDETKSDDTPTAAPQTITFGNKEYQLPCYVKLVKPEDADLRAGYYEGRKCLIVENDGSNENDMPWIDDQGQPFDLDQLALWEEDGAPTPETNTTPRNHLGKFVRVEGRICQITNIFYFPNRVELEFTIIQGKTFNRPIPDLELAPNERIRTVLSGESEDTEYLNEPQVGHEPGKIISYDFMRGINPPLGWHMFNTTIPITTSGTKTIIKKTLTNKFMSIISKLTRSEEHKALSHFNLINEDGSLNRDGQHEWDAFIWSTGGTDKAEFTAKIVTAYKEETKRR